MSLGRSKAPYDAGVKAFKEGRPAHDNPYPMTQIRYRCAWAGGWSDAEMGYHNETPEDET